MHPPTPEQAAIIDAALKYDLDTGHLYWKDPRKRRGSARAGTKGSDGYIRVMVNYKMYSAVRLCWYLYYREWPPAIIDHINRNPSDNRITNLRLSNHSDNAMNSGIRVDNSSGARGVTFDTKWGRYRARLRRTELGWFDTLEEAKQAYREALDV